VLLEVRLLPEVDAAGQAVEGADALVDALMHVAIAGGGEDLGKTKS
jgi:hypothetical protein